MTVIIRAESQADDGAIHTLLVDALGRPEADLVDAFRANGSLVLSLVAVDEAVATGVVGHVAVSRLAVSGGRAGALGPLAVAADRRRSGLGSRLVADVLERSRASGDDAMLVLGDPHFYGRFGFSAEDARRFRTPWDGPYQQAIALTQCGRGLGGTTVYPAAFAKLG